MVKPREVETEEGIQDQQISEKYDEMSRNNKYWRKIVSNKLIRYGINTGHALEIGPGPGYIGLDWLSKTKDTKLTGLDIGPTMINITEKNALEMGLSERTNYVLGDATKMPFEAQTFDSVFASATLHEWSNPQKIFDEISRVLKPRGKYFIIDLRRDMNYLVKIFLRCAIRDNDLKPGLKASINASYTKEEVSDLLSTTLLQDAKVKKTIFGIEISGLK